MGTLIKRKNYLQKLLAYKDHDLIKVVTGLRRSGKSTLFELYQQELLDMGVFPNQIVSINFEAFEMRHFLQDLDALYAFILEKLDLSNRCYVLLDEIQNVQDFERLVDGLYVKKNLDVYITGSNANLLSSELATHLSGRYIELSILPFSFYEYLIAREIDLSNQYLNYERLFFDYVNETSLPKGVELRAGGYDQVYAYLKAIYATIVEKDITQRHQINDQRAFSNVTQYVASCIGSAISPNNIAKALQQDGKTTHNTTVEKYLDYLVDSFVIYRVHRFDLKGKKQLATQEKYYLVDTGFYHLLLGKERTADRGHLLENIVYLELLRRGYQVWTGTNRNSEVDFVCKTPQGDLEYYQVAWLLADEATRAREFGALEQVRDHYPKWVLSTDNFTQGQNGIKHVNVFEWLLNHDIYRD